MPDLDRFAVGLPDPQQKPAAVVAKCEACGASIFLGDDAVESGGAYFCDSVCFMRFMGARIVAAGMED
jgi:hypothetical protein